MLNFSIKRFFLALILSSLTLTVHAEDAPVFDVDNYPPQFAGQADAGGGASIPAATTAGAPSSAVSPDVPVMSLTTDQRIARVEQQIKNMQHSEAAAKLEGLQKEIQVLRGQVEDLLHQVQQIQSQQKAMYTDLDKRINKSSNVAPAAIENDEIKPSSKKAPAVKSKTSIPAAAEPAVSDTPNTAAATPVAATAVAANKKDLQPNPAEEQQIYQTAYDLIRAKKFAQAIAALQDMLKKYPTGQFAANAHYWLGELYGMQDKNNQAAVEFAYIVKNFPDSPKVADAQLSLGQIYAAQFKWSEAKSTFKKVMNNYPGTASARLAAQQLKQMKLAGH